MKNPNAVVGAVIAVNRNGERGFTIELEGNRSVRIDGADQRAAGLASVFEQLQKGRKPAYIEIDPATDAITRVRVPVVVRVQDLVTDAAGDVRVRLQRSHAMPGIRRASADYEEVLGTLREAKAKGDWVVLTADGPEIIDVRPYKPPGDEPPPFRDELPRPRLPVWRWKWWPWNWFWFRCVSRPRAQQLFDLCAAQSCAPLTVPVPCIPFMYPEDGCWARASEMCRLLILDGAKPRKVWIDGSLHALTRNSPYCEIFWGWHVAPTICVRTRGFFFTQEQVIDPSLFTTPVSQATWKGVQGDPAATLTATAHTYYASWHPADPTYTETNSDLATYRAALQSRSLGPDGPPPYAICP
ncbi:MAG: hypothetical protein JWO56_1619 [Acidobacteria bacterium]|nr:hypothetical protein [Acidobacteriota bacterium]